MDERVDAEEAEVGGGVHGKSGYPFENSSKVPFPQLADPTLSPGGGSDDSLA